MGRQLLPFLTAAAALNGFAHAFSAYPNSVGWVPAAARIARKRSFLQAATLAAPGTLINMTDAPTALPLPVPPPTTALNGIDEQTSLPLVDPSSIEFVSLDKEATVLDEETLFDETAASCSYPFASMLRGSAAYIAAHQGEICVFHIPSELLQDTPSASRLMDDIALAWLLGLKVVIVVGCHYATECCSLGFNECNNALKVTDDKMLRYIEEEAGYSRCEIERMLNKSLRLHGGMSKVEEHSPLPNGNVVGGNFYTSKPFGVVKGMDYQNTGYPSKVYTEKIKEVLNRGDIVLLTTVGSSRLGTCVNVNGNHLAASVASALEAHKLVYMSSHGTVLRRQGETKSLQDIPVSGVKAFLDYHKVQVHRAGFASFNEASSALEEPSVEMLLHMGWASWALEQGVKRAHIVNPGDGALLEELYTAKHGANTCLYRDDEHDEFDDEDDFDILDSMLPEHQDEVLFSKLL